MQTENETKDKASVFYVGIDISKATFTVAQRQNDTIGKATYETYDNDEKGVLRFLKTLTDQHHCILESTGNYDKRLLYVLCRAEKKVSVISPSQSAAYAKVLKRTHKTDEADALLLLIFGEKEQPDAYSLADDKILILKQQRMVLRQLKRQKTAVKNQQEALSVLPNADPFSQKQLTKMLDFIEKQIQEVNNQMNDITQSEFGELMELVSSVKGIGKTIATALIEATNGFKNFDNAKQLASFIGTVPTHCESGTSVKKSVHISKKGVPELRALMYNATWSAVKSNKTCRELYLRLKKNNKPSKVALMAVINKLLNQIIAVVKSKIKFDNDFVPAKPEKRTTTFC